jgi:hypothetical protein
MDTTWTIEWMQTTPTTAAPPECVITAAWRVVGRQDGFSSTIYGTVTFDGPGDPFIPYNSLTQDQVLSWVWENGVDKEETEAALQQQLDIQINPPLIIPPLPWS